jgi:hypothetical protein
VVWSNAPFSVYHGILDDHASAISAAGADPAKGSALTDFGRGFYVTTSMRQARQWADQKHLKRLQARRDWKGRAAVVEFLVDRDWFAGLRTLIFTFEGGTGGYWDFVAHCRRRAAADGAPPDHGARSAGKKHYDAVLGPVSLWPQRLVIKDCDQISFHGAADDVRELKVTGVTFGSPRFDPS